MAANEVPLGYWCTLVGQQYLASLRGRLGSLGIDRWYFTLVRISEMEGPITQQRLADELHLDKATMVRAIDHLSACGYVARRPCPHDRRKHHIELLPKALPAIKQVRQAFTELNDQAFKGIPAAERKLLLAHLKDMLKRLAPADHGEEGGKQKKTGR